MPDQKPRQWPREQYEVTRWTGRDGQQREQAQRRAEEGELCTCGRPAITVYISDEWGETGYCGVSDGGQPGPCVFCGAARPHDGRCPEYRIRLDREVGR